MRRVVESQHVVDYWLVLDVSGTVGIFEGVEGLHEVTVAGGDAGDHQGAAVAAQ